MTYRIYSRLCRPSYESKWKKICKKFWFYKTYHMEKASIMWKNILYWIFLTQFLWPAYKSKLEKNISKIAHLIFDLYGKNTVIFFRPNQSINISQEDFSLICFDIQYWFSFPFLSVSFSLVTLFLSLTWLPIDLFKGQIIQIWPFLKRFARNKMIRPFGHFLMLKKIVYFKACFSEFWAKIAIFYEILALNLVIFINFLQKIGLY